MDNLEKEILSVQSALSTNKLAFKSIGEILNIDFPEQQWLVDSFIPANAITVLAGAPGSAKSFAALYMAIQIARGNNVFNFTTTKTSTVFIDQENNAQLIKDRAKKLGATVEDELYFLGKENFFNITDEKNRDDLLVFIKEKGVKLLVFDSITEILGSLNEKESMEMNQLYALLRPFLNEGLSILIIAHLRKPNQFEKVGLNSIKGSVTIGGFVDMGIIISNEDDEISQKNTLVLECVKSRFAKKFDKFKVEFFDTPDGKIEFQFAGSASEELQKRLSAQEGILEILKLEKRTTRQTIIEFLKKKGISPETADRALKDLLAMDKIERTKALPGEDKRTKYFTLKTALVGETFEESEENPYLDGIATGKIPF